MANLTKEDLEILEKMRQHMRQARQAAHPEQDAEAASDPEAEAMMSFMIGMDDNGELFPVAAERKSE